MNDQTTHNNEAADTATGRPANDTGNPSPALAQPLPLVPGAPLPFPKVEPKFKSGDQVTMKSGSPTMTVARMTDDGRAEVCYFDEEKGVFSGAMFWQDMLDIVTPDA